MDIFGLLFTKVHQYHPNKENPELHIFSKKNLEFGMRFLNSLKKIIEMVFLILRGELTGGYNFFNKQGGIA